MTRTEAIEIISRVEVGTKATEAARDLAISSLRQMDYLIETHQVIEIKDVPDEVLAQIQEGLGAGKICILERTNADRIRAMSDEELARFIPNWSYTDACKCGEHYVGCNNECEKCVAEWLKQPAEEGDQ